MSVTTYEFWKEWGSDCGCDMLVVPDGNYVHVDEYNALNESLEFSRSNYTRLDAQMTDVAKEHFELRAEIESLRKDAERYRWLSEQAYLNDPYDQFGTGASSWNWTIELATGKSKGRAPPNDTPTFNAIVDAAMAEDRSQHE